MGKFCTGCGKELKDGEKFCNSCGLSVTPGSMPETPEPLVVNEEKVKKGNRKSKKGSKKHKKTSVYLVLILVILIAGGAVYLLRDTIWDAWLKRGDIVTVNGVVLREGQANSIVTDPREDAWKDQEDIEKVSKAIEGQIEKFKKAAGKNDVKGVLKLFDESRQELYRDVLEQNTESLKLLEEVFENMEMVYLSPVVNSKEVLEKRIAEYRVGYEGQSFPVVFIFQDGKWLIHSL